MHTYIHINMTPADNNCQTTNNNNNNSKFCFLSFFHFMKLELFVCARLCTFSRLVLLLRSPNTRTNTHWNNHSRSQSQHTHRRPNRIGCIYDYTYTTVNWLRPSMCSMVLRKTITSLDASSTSHSPPLHSTKTNELSSTSSAQRKEEKEERKKKKRNTEFMVNSTIHICMAPRTTVQLLHATLLND